MRRLTAQQNAERWAIIGRPTTTGDCVHIEGIDIATLDALMKAGYCDPEQTQNDSPTVREFAEFMRTHEGVTAHGYVISPDRDDSRVSLEGLAYTRRGTGELLEAFIQAFRHADEFTVTDHGLYCWWD
jgi:hypothetical protein